MRTPYGVMCLVTIGGVSCEPVPITHSPTFVPFCFLYRFVNALLAFAALDALNAIASYLLLNCLCIVPDQVFWANHWLYRPDAPDGSGGPATSVLLLFRSATAF